MLVYNGLCCLFKTDVLCGGFFEYADMKCLISSLQNSRIRWRGESCWSVRDSQRVDVILFFSQSLQYGADM